MDLDKFILMDPDDIPYDTLSEEVLQQLVLNQDDLFVATHSLGELSRKQSILIEPTAVNIIEQNYGDHHLVAHAFEVLYGCNRDLSMSLIPLLIKTDDIVILNSIVREVYFDTCHLPDSAETRQLFTLLKKEILKKEITDFSDPEDIQGFLSHVSQLNIE